MTTEAAAALYLAEHLLRCQGRAVVVHNPNNQPVESLPVIYGFNNGGITGGLAAALLAEDGAYLGGHCCSDEGYIPHDLGIIEGSRKDRHEGFRAHYPGGYRMEFVSYDDIPGHAGLQSAFALNKAALAAAKETT